MARGFLVLSLFLLISGYIHEGYGQSPLERRQEEVADGSDGPHSSETMSEQEMEELEASQFMSDVREDEFLSNGDDHSHLVRRGTHKPHRVKRTSFNQSYFIWTHRIPYVINFTGPITRRMRQRKVLDKIEDGLCVKFYDVKGRIDESDVEWPTKNGFETNAYLKFIQGSACVGSYGRGSGRGPRKTSPCYSYFSMMHETMHAMGALHAQKLRNREKYITVHNDNIRSNKRSQYDKTAKPERVYSAFFDSISSGFYGRNFFSVDGWNTPTYDFLRPDMGQLVGPRSIKTLLYEMNVNYKCKETFCPDVQMDCGPGYLTYVHDKCVCICPDQYDPDTGCTTLIDKVEGPKSWPNIPFTMYKEGECPDGFAEGTIPIPGLSEPIQTGPPLPVDGNVLNIGVCTKTTPADNITWNDWPLSSMCIGKVKDVPCGLPFVDSEFDFKTKRALPLPTKGSVGDVVIEGHHITVKFCCYEDAPCEIPARLPTAKPFRLLMTKDGCQEVDGMFPVQTNIHVHTLTRVNGYKPDNTIHDGRFNHSSCLYIPPVYGCNRIFKLSSDQKTVRFSTPSNGGMRESNRRCFFAFQAPLKSRLRLTFNKFSIHPEDKFYVKRFHPWTNAFRVTFDSRPTQIITERNYLFVEFWSFYQEDSQYTGADLTVDLLLDDEMCYNADLQGSDYAGDKAVTELYEDCLPWKDAVTCPDFPWEYSLTLLNSDNKCRNLAKEEMLQPWCYVKVKGTECVRRYCDVCNEADLVDLNQDCGDKLETDSQACADTVFRNNCSKTCGVPTAPYDQNKVKCPKPRTQAPLRLMGNPRDSHDVGKTVKVTDGRSTTRIQCTTHGWEPFGDQWDQTLCMDRSQSCQNALKNFPDFCTNDKSMEIARAFCRKSCSVCK